MISKTPLNSALAPVKNYEGAITSSFNIKVDEVILKNFEANPSIYIILLNNRSLELPLHLADDRMQGTLIIPEKYYNESQTDDEMRMFLESAFDNQRKLDVEIYEEPHGVMIEPIRKNRCKFSFFY